MLALSVSEMAELSSLLDQAMPMDSSARRAWLDQLPPQHQKLTGPLRRSLLEECDTDAFSIQLQTLPRMIGETGAGLRPRLDLSPGSQVGPYRLLCKLGAGGMAEVWKAQRADRAFRRDVALKVPMFSERRPDLADRFSRECDILAGLEHPNIVRMYDAGTSAEGLPYLAMEYVRGEPLIEWCEARELGVEERLDLFLQVLDAVEYAHGRQVVHRDLKPSNILVGEDGQVRLLDFGVARMAAGGDPQDTALTRLYGRALTPDYASPELLCGQTADARSDIYSLGVVLYELVTGSRPYRMKTDASVTRLRRDVAAARIERPSIRLPLAGAAVRRVAASPAWRALQGELDRIVLRALSRKARDRYESVAEFSDDLRHCRDKSPTGAGPRRRHPAPVAGRPGWFQAGAMVLAFTVLCAIGLWMMRASLPPAQAMPGQSVGAEGAIAVLPFVDLSDDGRQENFAEGVADQIRSALSLTHALPVSGRTAASYFKGRPSTIAEIARDLKVGYVLEGSVRNSGRHLRISAELVKADNGYLVWSGTYDRDLDDTLRLQDEVACVVVDGLKASLLAAPAAVPAGRACGAAAPEPR